MEDPQRGNTINELGLDPSDPLTLLLQSGCADSDSVSSKESLPDWSPFSALWPPSIDGTNGTQFIGGNENAKFNEFGMDFDLSVPMDLDFANSAMSMAINPEALHFNDKDYEEVFGVLLQPHELLQMPFPFTFSSPSLSSASAPSDEEQRSSTLSVTESPPMIEQYPPTIPQVSSAPNVQTKLSIPRVIRPVKPAPIAKAAKQSSKSLFQTPGHVSSSASSSPSPGPCTSNSSSESSQTASIIQGTSVIPRPKTSHTTIERRYRTNLNARIKSLRQAVPALRVLENNGREGDIIDERGFVDGVKVARKGSKANVLGKAVEYIRVLKRREARLKREQAGLRSLVCRLGGDTSLSQWDKDWIANHGGPERDEINSENEATEASDDDEGEGDGDEDGDDEERARKKAKVTKMSGQKKERKVSTSTASTNAGEPVLPGKRKRGRPRKNPPTSQLSLTATAPVMPTAPPVPAHQYLLAVFALFSFFKSPFAPASMAAHHPHTHTGYVLSDGVVGVPLHLSLEQWGWNDFVQVVHLFISLLVFVTITFPWIPSSHRVKRMWLLKLLTFTSHTHNRGVPADITTHIDVAFPSHPSSPSTNDSESGTESFSSTDKVESTSGSLRKASFFGGVIPVRLCEFFAANATCNASITGRLQSYMRFPTRLRSSTMVTADHTSKLCTAALRAHRMPLPFADSRAKALWNRARKPEDLKSARPYERLVLDSMDLEEAANCSRDIDLTTSDSLLRVLATSRVRDRIRDHACVLFLRTTSPKNNVEGDAWACSEQNDKGSESDEEMHWRETITAGKSLGGQIDRLVEAFEMAWQCAEADSGGLLSDEQDDSVDGEVAALLNAVLLYRRVFPSDVLSCTDIKMDILSPPPSPSLKCGARNYDNSAMLNLRRTLGSSVFDFSGGEGESNGDGAQRKVGEALEEARDRVVDLLVEYERRGRGRVSKFASEH